LGIALQPAGFPEHRLLQCTCDVLLLFVLGLAYMLALRSNGRWAVVVLAGFAGTASTPGWFDCAVLICAEKRTSRWQQRHCVCWQYARTPALTPAPASANLFSEAIANGDRNNSA
jgi:hypothetical protein